MWIHGGAYLAGSSEESAYDGSALCEQGDIVVVTISYRLGIFGYLYDEGKGISNLGLKDQISALRWVKKHIALFGGDPDRITLAGQPLEELSMEQMLDVQKEVLSQSRSMMPYGPLEPDFSGKVTVPSLEKVLVTWQKDDASAFVALALGHQEHFGGLIDRIATRIASDKVFGAPSRKYAKALNASGIQTDIRCLDWRPEGSPFGACHCLELSLLFGSWERWSKVKMIGTISREEWEKKGQALREEWIAFIR